jgi:hypothetical protein
MATIVLLMLVGWMVCTTTMALIPGPENRKTRHAVSPARPRASARLSLPPTSASEIAER